MPLFLIVSLNYHNSHSSSLKANKYIKDQEMQQFKMSHGLALVQNDIRSNNDIENEIQMWFLFWKM